MMLLKPAVEPTPTADYLFGRYSREYAEWGKYLLGW